MFRRIRIIFIASIKEYYRDRSGFTWNILFPFFIIAGFSFIFTDENRNDCRIGITGNTVITNTARKRQYEELRSLRHIKFIDSLPLESGLDKLAHHKIDLLVNPDEGKYWKSGTSPAGYIAERILLSCDATCSRQSFTSGAVNTREIPYVEWLFPGILCMNIMFSALYGVGYAVVRDRKNGILKRLSVTMLTPFEYLSGHILSRMCVIFATTSVVFAGCTAVYGFQNRGSYLSLLIVFLMGSFSMVSLSLIVGSRSSSEIFAEGLLNFLSWPMMLLSEIWFSLEGARPWIKKLAHMLPLTHLSEGVRNVMNDGASLYDIRYNLASLAAMAVIFLCTGSLLFRWHNRA